jgi:hypothetical protein
MPDDRPDRQATPADSDPACAYDVFISYSSKDQDWVRGLLLQRLESHGLRVCMDFRDFRPGVPSVEEMERAVLTSRCTLIVLTPHYITSGWTKFERLMRQTLDADTQEYRLIPLLKAPCTLPVCIGYLTQVDFTDPQQEGLAWHRLLAVLDPAQPDTQVALIARTPAPAPALLPPASRMPFRPDTRFVTINALAERGLALAKQLERTRFGLSRLPLADARSWYATYRAWTTECLSVLDADLQLHFEDAHAGNEGRPGVEQCLALLVQCRDPDSAIAESAQVALRSILMHHSVDELLYPQQDLLDTARRRAFPATHVVAQELKEVIAASQRRYTNGRIDYLFTNNGCESHWWLRPLKGYARKSEYRVHGWFDAIQVYAPDRERTIVQAVCREVLHDGRLTDEQRTAIQRHRESVGPPSTR